jgi:hypothetical protein
MMIYNSKIAAVGYNGDSKLLLYVTAGFTMTAVGCSGNFEILL